LRAALPGILRRRGKLHVRLVENIPETTHKQIASASQEPCKASQRFCVKKQIKNYKCFNFVG
jgi:hypothetical protein